MNDHRSDLGSKLTAESDLLRVRNKLVEVIFIKFAQVLLVLHRLAQVLLVLLRFAQVLSSCTSCSEVPSSYPSYTWIFSSCPSCTWVLSSCTGSSQPRSCSCFVRSFVLLVVSSEPTEFGSRSISSTFYINKNFHHLVMWPQ